MNLDDILGQMGGFDDLSSATPVSATPGDDANDLDQYMDAVSIGCCLGYVARNAPLIVQVGRRFF